MADDLTQSELVPVGGTWGGLLFANPVADVQTALTWSIAIDFAEIEGLRRLGHIQPGRSSSV